MIALAVSLAILALIALLRFGVSVEYSANGLAVAAHAGPLSISILPQKKKALSAGKEARLKARKEVQAKKKAEKKAKKKAEKQAEKQAGEKTGEKKPGALKTVEELLPAIKTMLSRFRRRLLIKKLVIYYTAANDDPSKAAMAYGATNAAVGVLIPLLEKSFRIRRRDFRILADFSATQQSIYANAAISMAVWEAFYMIFAMLPTGIRILRRRRRKDGQKNGKNPDKRIDGNNDAESKRDDRR